MSEAQAQLPKLLRKHDCFAICRHGKPLGVFVSHERMAALLETVELLENPDAMKAVRDYKAGRLSLRNLEDVPE